jgi:hypothetical protein
MSDPKIHRRWLRLPRWAKGVSIAAVLVLVIAIGAALRGSEDKAAKPAATAAQHPQRMSAKALIDLLEASKPSLLTRECAGVKALGPRQSPYVGFKTFARSYRPEANQPDAFAVYTELLTRC